MVLYLYHLRGMEVWRGGGGPTSSRTKVDLSQLSVRKIFEHGHIVSDPHIHETVADLHMHTTGIFREGVG